MSIIATSLPQKKPRRRLPRQEREKLIIEEAIRFFAEVGLDGQTRVLARRLGVTQPLLYRYFPDKESLIERIYKELFADGWDEKWDKLMTEESRSLHDRVTDLYRRYARINFSYERMRLFIFAGLKDGNRMNGHIRSVRERTIDPICRAIRSEIGRNPDTPISDEEIACVSGLHGAIGYVGIRRWVYQETGNEDIDATINILVGVYLPGAIAAFQKMIEIV